MHVPGPVFTDTAVAVAVADGTGRAPLHGAAWARRGLVTHVVPRSP